MDALYKHLFIISLISCSILTGCSKKVWNPVPKIIKIDFRNPQSIPDYTHVPNGQDVVIKLENVNQNIFKVTSNVTQTDFNTELPAVFSGIKLPGNLNVSFQSAAQAENNIAPNKKGPHIAEKSIDRKTEENIETQLGIINESANTIKATVDLANDIKNLVNSCDKSKSYGAIEKELISIVKKYLNTGTTDRKQQIDELRLQLGSTVEKAVRAGAVLDNIVPIYLSNLSDGPRKDLIKELYEKATTAVAEIQKIKDDNRVQTLIDSYNLINPSNFKFISEKIKVNADEITFKIEVTSDKPLPCDIPAKTVISQTYRTKDGLKIDFSSGAFFNLGNEDFLGRDIQYKPVNDTIRTIQAKDGGKRILLSIGAFMHIYKRSGTNVNFAISPGISTTTGFDALNFHLGASVLLGNENRFVITVGTTLRESKVLDKNYEFDKEYKKSLLPDAPPTIAVFPKWGGFVSLTYNFSKFKKQG